MGRGKTEKPKRLSWKLRELRLKLGMSHKEMYEALAAQKVKVHIGYISLFEIGERTPSLLVLLAYSNIAGISMNLLVDDSLDLPEQLPQ
jgi:transcriptional regulator with XRE-family HTH domain